MMDPRLIALLQMMQKPVRRFDDGGEVYDYDTGSEIYDYGSDYDQPIDFGGIDWGNLFDAGENIDVSNIFGDATGPAEDIGQYIQDLEQTGTDVLANLPTPEYGEDATINDDIWRNLMQEGSLDSEGKFNAARDSQAANEYLERVMGVPRSEIDDAYRTQVPRYVTVNGNSYITGVAPPGMNVPGKPGTRVTYDDKGNIVDPNTGKIIEPAPGRVTGPGVGGGTGTGGGRTGGTGGGGGSGSQSNMSWLLPLLLMMLAMNRNQGQGTSQAVIPKLSASREQLPYQQVQQAPGYRPGQGGVRYVSDVQYKPMADGGITALMAQGGTRGLLHGAGDGVSDSIPATIGGTQPARLARGEFVVDARTVSELGNGSTEAGAERLYEMMDRVHNARKKAKRGQDTKASKHLPA